MSLANKTFRNNSTGEEVKVIDSFENIAILENKQKIDVTLLMDSSKYTEQIDPASFFNNQGSYNSLADKIKNISTNEMVDEDGVVSMKVDDNGIRPSTDESAVIMTTEEDERAELLKKYGFPEETDQVSKQNQAFAKILGDDEELPKAPVKSKSVIEVDNVQRVEVNREIVQPPVQRIAVEDPIITMFKGVKRNVKFDINIEISDKIPRLDFIEMMEDSYETSLIEFLAEEFTNKILQNPEIIKDTITDKIKQLVYGAPNVKPVLETLKKKERNNEEKINVDENPQSVGKLTASQRVDAISKLESIKLVEKALKGEKAKSVKEAGSKRIKELEKIN
jgi:hypothetical protein